MADFAGTVAKVDYKAPFGNHPGTLVFTITLSSTSYVSGNLNIATLAGKLPGLKPEHVKNIFFTVGAASAAYMPSYLHAATPTFANLGTLKLFTATAAEATGSLSLTIRATAILSKGEITI